MIPKPVPVPEPLPIPIVRKVPVPVPVVENTCCTTCATTCVARRKREMMAEVGSMNNATKITMDPVCSNKKLLGIMSEVSMLMFWEDISRKKNGIGTSLIHF